MLSIPSCWGAHSVCGVEESSRASVPLGNKKGRWTCFKGLLKGATCPHNTC
jgi:hypothetical protein